MDTKVKNARSVLGLVALVTLVGMVFFFASWWLSREVLKIADTGLQLVIAGVPTLIVLLGGLGFVNLTMDWPAAREPENRRSSLDSRTSLAFIITFVSVVGVLVFGLHMINIAVDKDETSSKVLTAVLPLFGTWVGTILAFYYGRQNFEAAQENVNKLVDKVTSEQKLRETQAKDAGLRFGEMTVFQLTDKLKATIDANKDKYNRFPVLDSKLPVFVAHRSLINEFLLEQAIAKVQIVDLTFQNLRDDVNYKPRLDNSFRTVGERDTLADVKKAMASTDYCQDIFVTLDGTPDSEVIRWITNRDIERASTV